MPQASIFADTRPHLGTWRQPTPGFSPCFSGEWLIEPLDFALVAVNVVTGLWHKLLGVSKVHVISTNPPLRYFPPASPAVEITGDCWQSIGNFAATPNTPKWVVAPSTATMCKFKGTDENAWGLMVWKFINGFFHWHGFIPGRAKGEVRLDADFAWVQQPDNLWMVFNLNDLVVHTQDTTIVPPFQRQMDYQGTVYHLNFERDPVTMPSPNLMIGVAEGVPVPELPTCCPEDFTKRQQDWAVIWNTLKVLKQLNPTLVIPPVSTVQHFKDMPPGNIFAEATDSLTEAGIIAGKNPCEKP